MLIVEDGTAKADAESYIDTADAETYLSNRGDTVFAALQTSAQEALLRQATEFMVAEFRLRWAGYRMTDSQALDWPRYEVPKRDSPGGYAAMPAYYPQNQVPVEVQRACALLALAANSGDLNAELGRTVKQTTVGPLTTVYADGAPEKRRFPQIEQILQPLFKNAGGAGTMSLARA